MTIQFSDAIRNAMLDTIEATVGTSAILRIRTGAQPANIAAASSGTVLATLNLPSDWMAAASGGAKAKLGTWEDTAADGTGTAAHWEIVASNGTTRGFQGSVSATGGGGDMEVDSTAFVTGQGFTVTAFTLTAPGA